MGISTTGLRWTMDLMGMSSCFTKGLVSLAGSTVLGVSGCAGCNSSGEQILQEQFFGSVFESVTSHSRCGKKSAGLLNLFFLPSG